MNATNRGVNRVILLIAGILLICVGSATVMPILWPVAGDLWKGWLSTGVDWMVSADNASRISEATTVSWFTLAFLTLLVLLVVITVLVVARLGGGRSSVVIREEAEGEVQGSVTIRGGFAADAITQSLASHDEILSSKVNARRLWGADVLHVSVTPRQNVSPVEVAETVTGLVDRLATLLGREISTLVTIHSGIRSRLAADQSRVN